MRKSPIYFLLMAILIAGAVLFLDLYQILQDNAVKIVLLFLAASFLLVYLYFRYKNIIKIRKNRVNSAQNNNVNNAQDNGNSKTTSNALEAQKKTNFNSKNNYKNKNINNSKNNKK